MMERRKKERLWWRCRVGIVGVAAGAFFLLPPRGFSGSLS